VKHWIGKTVTLNDCWGPSAETILKAPNGKRPEFRLRARELRDGRNQLQPVQLVAEISAGSLAEGWQGAVFTPLGSTPVSGISGLPPWETSHRDRYRQLLEGGTTNIGDSRTLRLEAVVPFINADGTVIYDTVRLYFAENAVQGGPVPHLVIVKTSLLIGPNGTVQARQDGSAQGPPH
jgi:hypothetical protein